MSGDLPTTSYAVLGLLSFAPMSGYDLAAYADRTIAHFWPLSKTQVYTELSRLEALGLVRGTDVEQVKVPDKRVYELTADGARALDTWLGTPGYERQRLRSGLLVKTFFAHRMARERFVELLGRHRKEADATRAQLAEIADLLAGVPEAFFARATALLGLRSAEAALRWADEVEGELPDPSVFGFTPEEAAGSAHEFFRHTPPRRRTP